MTADNSVINEILLQALLTLLLLGASFSLILGFTFLLKPQWVAKLSHSANHWVSLRKPTKPLEVPHSLERHLYHYHHHIGVIILLSAAYTLYRFAFSYDHSAMTHTVATRFGNPVLVAWLLDAFICFIVPATLFVVFVGAAIALKPSLLKGVEQWANRWISTRKGIQPLEKQYFAADNWAFAHPRLFGWILIFASLYILSILLIFL